LAARIGRACRSLSWARLGGTRPEWVGAKRSTIVSDTSRSQRRVVCVCVVCVWCRPIHRPPFTGEMRECGWLHTCGKCARKRRALGHTPRYLTARDPIGASEGRVGERYASRHVTPNNLRRERKSQEGHRVERDPQARGLVHVHCVTCCVKI
jgi:hypothetical protein